MNTNYNVITGGGRDNTLFCIRRKPSIPNNIVVISEGELYEGSTWEALLFAKHNKLDNLTIIIDINSLIILGKTSDCLNLNPIKDKIAGLGIKTTEVDGHNLNELISCFEKSQKAGELNCILANTIKGKGCKIMENKKHWHYLLSL